MKKYYLVLFLVSLMQLQFSVVMAQYDTLVIWNFPAASNDAYADGGITANLNREIVTRGGTAAIDFSNPGHTTNCASAPAWDAGAYTKYWRVSFTTTAYTDLRISSRQRSENNGPRDFKIQYTLDTNTSWTNINSTYDVQNNWTSGLIAWVLPAACFNQPIVYLRWIQTTNVSVSGATVDQSGNSFIDNILITGVFEYQPTYAVYPYQMNFEDPWVDGNDSLDIPASNWLNTPASGDCSWRMENNVSTWSSGSGAYTPPGALGSGHSARFHDYGCSMFSDGSLDLYLNCSASGNKALSFFCINQGGLEVHISQDGGNHFSLLGYCGSHSTWKKETFYLGTTTSSTVVIRFNATSFYGFLDKGIDQVEVGSAAEYDAGITSIVAPHWSIPAGSQAVKVNLKNFGLDTLNAVTIHWSIDGVAQTPYLWSGSLGFLHSIDSLNIGVFNFIAGTHLIKAYTAFPNDSADQNVYNDTVQTTVNVTHYANLPVYEGFDGIWVNGNDSLDIPSLVWTNTPATGNTSWRRDDEGGSAYWTSDALGIYVPSGSNSTAHSARFHSSNVATNNYGSLRVNLNFNQTGAKKLSYSLINPDTAAHMYVYLSKNDGTPNQLISSHDTVSNWTNFVVNLGSSMDTQANIIFVATGDSGLSDMGLDEVSVEIADHNLELSAILAPMNGCGLSSNEAVVVNIKNLGTSPEHHFPVSYDINGVNITEIYTDTLAPGGTGTYVFLQTADMSLTGTYEISAYTGLSNEFETANDTVRIYNSSVLAFTSFPSIENFEGQFHYVFLFDTSQSHAAIAVEKGKDFSRGLFFSGLLDTSPGSTDTTTLYGAWENHPDYHTKATTCMIDASVLSSPELLLDIRQTYTVGLMNSRFRVMLNDTIQLTDINGISEFHASSHQSDAFITHIFDLQAYAGMQFHLSLEACCNSNKVVHEWGNTVCIDNFILRNKPIVDFSLDQWIGPQGGICDMSNDSIRVLLSNCGLSPESDIPIKYSIDNGQNWIIDTAYVTVMPGDSAFFTFLEPANFSDTGAYPCLAVLCLNTDEYSFNDTLRFIVNSTPVIYTFPYLQNFESSFTGWTSGSIAGPDIWQLGTPDKMYLSSAHSGTNTWSTLLSDRYPNADDCFLLSPCFDLSNFINPQITIWLKFRTSGEDDVLVFETSVNNGPWTHFAPNNNFYNNTSTAFPVPSPNWSGSSGTWIKFKSPMQGFAGVSELRVRFRFISGASYMGDGFSIDDFRLFDTTSGLAIPNSEMTIPSVFPNPASNEISIDFGNQECQGTYYLYNANGMMMKTDAYQQGNMLRIDLQNLPNGLYCLILHSKEYSWKYKIIKE